MNTLAVTVLIENIQNLNRAFEFAERISDAEVWSILAAAQLKANMVKEAIEAYVKADNPSCYREVVEVGAANGNWDDLVNYLQMAHRKTKVSIFICTRTILFESFLNNFSKIFYNLKAGSANRPI